MLCRRLFRRFDVEGSDHPAAVVMQKVRAIMRETMVQEAGGGRIISLSLEPA